MFAVHQFLFALFDTGLYGGAKDCAD